MTSDADRMIDAEIAKFCDTPTHGMSNDEVCAEIDAILLTVAKRMVIMQYLAIAIMLLAIGCVIYMLYEIWIVP